MRLWIRCSCWIKINLYGTFWILRIEFCWCDWCLPSLNVNIPIEISGTQKRRLSVNGPLRPIQTERFCLHLRSHVHLRLNGYDLSLWYYSLKWQQTPKETDPRWKRSVWRNPEGPFIVCNCVCVHDFFLWCLASLNVDSTIAIPCRNR